MGPIGVRGLSDGTSMRERTIRESSKERIRDGTSRREPIRDGTRIGLGPRGGRGLSWMGPV